MTTSNPTRALLTAFACTAAFHAPAAADDPGATLLCDTTSEDRVTSRTEAQSRSQSWLDEKVPYSRQSCHQNQHGSYRSDCSGYVSMAWGLNHSRNTATLHEVSTEIPRADLRPGDALNSANHAALFIRWEDGAKTRPVVREHTGPDGHPVVERSWSPETADTYTAIRYDLITEG